MKIFFVSITAFFAHIIFIYGQNTSPFWSLAGNSNASISSKLGTTNGQPLRIFTSNLERIRVATNGNVGIGTAASDFKTSIFSNKVETNNNTHVLRLSGRNPVLLFTDENNLANGYIKSWTNTPYAPFTNGLVIGSNPGYPIFFSTNFGATMTIAHNNNVGIGTTTPGFKLEVRSSVVESNNNTNLLKLRGRNPVLLFTDENNVGNGYIKSWTNAPYAPFTSGLVIGSNPGYPIFFSTNFGATMTITNNNNVGIGTTTPAYKLSVNGTIQAKEVRVETNWADYVFEKDYELQSLDNVAEYIKKEKHLPGIPSAKEIQQNGLAMGEVQTKMMEKIEELTLYLIEQKRQIEQLQKDNDDLKKKDVEILQSINNASYAHH